MKIAKLIHLILVFLVFYIPSMVSVPIDPSELNGTLWSALEKGDPSLVKAALNAGADANAWDPRRYPWEEPHQGLRPLHYMAAEGNTILAKILLEHGAHVNALSFFHVGENPAGGKTPLHFAVENSKLDMVELLSKNGADVNIQDGYGKKTPLHYAAENIFYGWRRKKETKTAQDLQSKVMEILLNNRGNANVKDAEGNTPLHLATKNEYTEIVNKLLKHGANPNIKNNAGKTPLHLATENAYSKIADVLLKNGADATIKDNEGKKPLTFRPIDPTKELWKAVEIEDVALAKEALKKGANVNAKKEDGTTLLHQAVSDGLDMVTVLLEHKANVNAKGPHGHTPLHIAISHGRENIKTKMIELLLGNRADLHAKDADGDTALHILIQFAVFYEIELVNERNIFEMLLMNGADANAKNNSGDTPLHLAAKAAKLLEFVELLLKYKADVALRNNKNQTALDIVNKEIEHINEALRTTANRDFLTREQNRYREIAHMLEKAHG